MGCLIAKQRPRRVFGVALGLVVVVLGTLLLVSERTNGDSRRRAEPQRTKATRADTNKNKQLLPEGERLRLRSSGDGVRVFEKVPLSDGAAVERFIRASRVPLSSDEIDLLREASSDDLGRMIAEAETNYIGARTPEDRARIEHRYTLLLQLASKLAEPGPEPSKAEQAAYQRYLTLKETLSSQLKMYPPEQRAEILERAKDQHFGAAQTASHMEPK